MTIEEKRIAIAESMGWTKWVNSIPSDDYGPKTREWWFPPGVQTGDFKSGKMIGVDKLTDYFHDPAAAVSLCEAMAGKGWYVVTDFNGQRTECIIRKNTHPLILHQAFGETFPIAVAECYGKAKGLW